MARDQVFISYSHKDKNWLERLQVHLRPLEHKAEIKVWADTQIDPGEKWKDEIQRALTSAKVAVLLVSPHFLASKFIHDNELPPLLAAADKEGVKILWVLVSDCSYQWTAIADYQAAYRLDKPLNQLRPAQRDSALVKVVRSIEKAWSSPLSPKTVNPEITPQETTRAAAAPRYGEAVVVLPPRSLSVIQNIHGLTTPQVQALQQQTAQALKVTVEFRDALKDGSQGPAMLVIPGGRFLMGSPAGELERRDNERQHEVEIAPFAIGKFAVTFEEYDHFAGTTGRERPGDGGWGRYRWPVINVTWFDAIAYAEWLSGQTGQCYRLPTEAEWEYACRAGTTTPFYFGETISTDQANYDGNYVYGKGRKGIYRQKTVEVGQFPANAWGLHDMHGNVWEWTCSVYSENYDGSEQRCAEPGTGGPCVLRGGSWDGVPRRVRGAARDDWAPRNGGTGRGFRLARTFP